MNDDKLTEARELLFAALKRAEKEPGDKVVFAGLAKSFETAFEYAWKSFKRRGDAAGLEIYTPRDALKAAAQLKLITDLELWNSFLNARNLSVHDYIGLGDKEFLAVIKRFHKEVTELKLI